MADISINGNVVRGKPLLNIAYTVNADCTGDAAFTVPDPSVGQKTRRISFALRQQGILIHYISLEADLSSRGLAENQCGHDSSLCGRSLSSRLTLQFLLEQLVDLRRVGLALAQLHDLAHEEAE